MPIFGAAKSLYGIAKQSKELQMMYEDLAGTLPTAVETGSVGADLGLGATLGLGVASLGVGMGLGYLGIKTPPGKKLVNYLSETKPFKTMASAMNAPSKTTKSSKTVDNFMKEVGIAQKIIKSGIGNQVNNVKNTVKGIGTSISNKQKYDAMERQDIKDYQNRIKGAI